MSLPFITEELSLDDIALLDIGPENEPLVKLDGSLPVAEADIEFTAEAAGIVDILPSPGDALVVLFLDSVIRRLLLLARGKVLLAISELGLLLLGCRDDSEEMAVVDALRPPDIDSELVLKFGGSTKLEMEGSVTSDETGEEPAIVRLDEIPGDGDDGSLRIEEVGKGLPMG